MTEVPVQGAKEEERRGWEGKGGRRLEARTVEGARKKLTSLADSKMDKKCWTLGPQR